MSQGNLIPSNGAVVFGATIIAFNTFELDEQQVVDDATPYGSGTTMGVSVGNETPTARLTAAGFAQKGVTGAKLGLDGTAFTAGPAAVTLTFDTGCTEAGSFVLQQIRVQHGRMRATVPVMLAAMSSGNITETWSTGS